MGGCVSKEQQELSTPLVLTNSICFWNDTFSEYLHFIVWFWFPTARAERRLVWFTEIWNPWSVWSQKRLIPFSLSIRSTTGSNSQVSSLTTKPHTQKKLWKVLKRRRPRCYQDVMRSQTTSSEFRDISCGQHLNWKLLWGWCGGRE